MDDYGGNKNYTTTNKEKTRTYNHKPNTQWRSLSCHFGGPMGFRGDQKHVLGRFYCVYGVIKGVFVTVHGGCMSSHVPYSTPFWVFDRLHGASSACTISAQIPSQHAQRQNTLVASRLLVRMHERSDRQHVLKKYSEFPLLKKIQQMFRL